MAATRKRTSRRPRATPTADPPELVVTPALGGSWLGVEVEVDSLPDNERAYIQVPPDYALVRCRESQGALVHVGTVYLVLRRFLAPA